MKKVNMKLIGVSVAALVGVATLTPVLVTAQGDSSNGRPTYTLAQIENGDLGDKITFNSIADPEANARGAIGDERNFVAAKPNNEVSDRNIPWKANDIQMEDGQTYTIRLYVHNNNPKGEEGVATGVTANFSMPVGVGSDLAVTGYINASNADPDTYWDEVHFVGDGNYWLEYVEGSATYNNGVGTFPLSNNVVAQGGVLLGYTTMDGNIPGCYKYDGEVHIQVVAHKSVTASVEKTVRLKGTKDWTEAVNAKVGDEVEYQIAYTNLMEDETVPDVIIRDILPSNVEYVPGSTVLYNSNHQDGAAIAEETLTTSGINIGDHGPKGNSYVRFTGKVVDNTLACGQNQLVNWANSTSNGEVTAKDDASVIVQKQCDEPTPTPSTPSEETPTEIVSTGPETIVVGAIGAGSVVTAAGYYLASRKKLM